MPSVARRSDHDYAGSAGFQPAGGEGTKSPLEPRSVQAWAPMHISGGETIVSGDLDIYLSPESLNELLSLNL